MRFVPVATLALAGAVLAPIPAWAQTVPDYQAALAAVPPAPPEAVVRACLPLQNYVNVAIPPNEQANPWLLSLLPARWFGTDPVAAARRDCETVRVQPVIAFNQGASEEIVTPPVLDEQKDSLR